MTNREAIELLEARKKPFSPFDMEHIKWGEENGCDCELCKELKPVGMVKEFVRRTGNPFTFIDKSGVKTVTKEDGKVKVK